VDSEVDFDGQHPFIELGGSSVEDQRFWYEDNFAGVWVGDCGWNGSHEDSLGLSINGTVSFRMERVTVNDYAELSSDPLLVQLVRGPTLFYLIGVYASKLFEKSGISESSEWGVEAMGSPLFSVMKSFSAVTVLSDGKIIEVVRMSTKTQR
jgi:hypothetical protein